MTDYQNELVMEHLDLVNWVIPESQFPTDRY